MFICLRKKIKSLWENTIKHNALKNVDTLTEYLLILRLLGAFLPHQRIQGSYKKAHFVYCCLMIVFCNILLVSLQWIDLINVIRSLKLEAMAQNLCLSLNCLSVGLKIINLTLCRKNIVKMFNLTKDLPIQFAKGQEHAKILDSNEKRIRLITRTFIYLAILTNIFSIINRIFDSDKALENFPFRAYRPKFVPEKYLSPLHSLLILWNAMCICIHDSMVMVLLSKFISQLVVLNSSLRSINASQKNSIQNLKSKLVSCIRHHQYICEFLHIFEQTFSLVFLMQFFVSLFMFGLVGFQVTVTKEYSRAQLTINFYCVCILLELFLFCYLAHQIIDAGNQIAPSIYCSAWYKCGRSFGKNVQIFIAIAQRPLTLTAGGFFIVSLETFTMVLTRSYSYVALLRQVYYENEA